MCKHIVGLAIRLKLTIPPVEAKNIPIGEKEREANHLQPNEHCNHIMVRRLAALGGSGIEGVTRRIMKYLMANQLGIQFNWKGQAAKLNFPANEKNDMQVAWAIKEWLKHLAARINQANKNK
ncbi:hypothetical protein NQ314_003341 [Rhamnusium bicolor]|uniref:DUF4806 domain-containing protein n=1 Tax=Rhamnusium bicolor TaxID=1586634 RepID=A0AAV8ZLZ8_9CUCU|nr:hypothetical protein NQ314_003341 [Rhamnusium bicolor]